jgi:hypothetical protein
MDLRERQDRVVWTGLIWLRTGTGGGLLWTFGFHKMMESSWVAAQLAASQEGLSSMNLVIRSMFCVRQELNLSMIFTLISWFNVLKACIVHSRRREGHRKQMHVISPSLLEWNHATIMWCVYRCRGVQSLNAG